MKRILFLLILLIPVLLLSQSNLWTYKVGEFEVRDDWSAGWFTWTTTGADSILSFEFVPQTGFDTPWNGLLGFACQVDTAAGTDALVQSQGNVHYILERKLAGSWWRVDTLDFSVYQDYDAQSDSTIEAFNPEAQIGNLLIYQTDPTSSGTRELEQYPPGAHRVRMVCSDSVSFKQWMEWKPY